MQHSRSKVRLAQRAAGAVQQETRLQWEWKRGTRRKRGQRRGRRSCSARRYSYGGSNSGRSKRRYGCCECVQREGCSLNAASSLAFNLMDAWPATASVRSHWLKEENKTTDLKIQNLFVFKLLLLAFALSSLTRSSWREAHEQWVQGE